MAEFTADRRAAFVDLVRAGSSIESACAEVAVSRPTISRWRMRGEHAPEGSEHAIFAEHLAAAQEEASAAMHAEMSLSELHQHVAVAVRGGSVRAMELMSRLLGARGRGSGHDAESAFDALDDELARARARRQQECGHGA